MTESMYIIIQTIILTSYGLWVFLRG